MPRGYRTGRIAMLLAIVLGILTLSFSTASRASRLQDAADVIEAGSGPLGERSFSLVGRNVYGDGRLQLYGYLSRVVGLTASDLFTEEPGSVQTARFTYVAELSDVSSASRADITITEGAGALRVYFTPSGGATWDDPASFAAGEVVAEFSLDLRDVLQLQAPGVGVSVGDGETVQRLAAEFTLDGDQVRFGGEGMERRIRYIAALQPQNDATVRFLTSLSGSATMTARPSRAVPLGGTAAAATPATSLDACPGVQPWLDQTLASLSRAAELGDLVAPADTLADLDRAELLQASQELTGLVAAQRDLEAPEPAAAANRLVVTALSTLSRGLLGASDAAAENDAGRFVQGQAALADGRSLIARAGEAVNAVAETCAG